MRNHRQGWFGPIFFSLSFLSGSSVDLLYVALFIVVALVCVRQRTDCIETVYEHETECVGVVRFVL